MISLWAWMPAKAGWSAEHLDALRETGFSALVCPDAATLSALLPLAREAGIPLHDQKNLPVELDDGSSMARYPEWARTRTQPWGALVRPFGEASILLTLAAVAAGAPLVALEVDHPRDAEALVAQLKALCSVLGVELTRLPKRAEGMTSQKTSQGTSLSGAKVAFQGEHGAYSEMAVFNLFDRKSTAAVPFKAFRDVFEAVQDGSVDYGMLPIENALAGAIDENFDLLLDFPRLHIVAETQVRVEHNLIGIPGTPLTAIRKVLSHPQGLAQSRRFLESHPEWEAVSFYDTAGSVAHVARTGDPSLAAIASAEAARVYGMEILAPGVETNHRNFTRFFLLGLREGPAPGEPNKATIVFATADEPGALSKCLAVFAAHGVNMKKLESRPIHGRPWDYMFYVDVALPADKAQFTAALAELEVVAEDCRLLGMYRA